MCLISGQCITKRVTLATGSLGHTGFFSKMNNMDLSREKKWPWLVFSNTKCLSLGSIDLSQGDRIVYRETRAVEEVTKTSDFPSVCKAVCSNEKIGGWWGGCLFLSLSSKDGLGLQFRTIALQVIHHVHHLRLNRNQICESQTGTSNPRKLLWELMDSWWRSWNT